MSRRRCSHHDALQLRLDQARGARARRRVEAVEARFELAHRLGQRAPASDFSSSKQDIAVEVVRVRCSRSFLRDREEVAAHRRFERPTLCLAERLC
jgi:hypothetical protein